MNSSAVSVPVDPLSAARACACPGLVRIVAARDGGLCRIKLPGGVLSAAQACAIADAAQAHGSSLIEATNRANLQLRGVRPGHDAVLRRALFDAGLGPVTDGLSSNGLANGRLSNDDLSNGDLSNSGPSNDGLSNSGLPNEGQTDDASLAARDNVRNLMLSPVAGRDPNALLDSAALAAPLLRMLQTDPRCAVLSPKFSVLLDGGERLAALDHPHDIWLAAMQGSCGEPQLAVGLAGCPPTRSRSATAHGALDQPALAAVAPAQAVELLRALLHAFIELAPAGATRMRDLLAVRSPEALLAHAEARLPFALRRGAAIAAWRRPDADPALRFGIHLERDPERCHVGGQPPLGRLDPVMLRGLASVAAEHGDGTLRVTPWQGMLLPGVAHADAERVLARLRAHGLLCDARAPLAQLIACAGSTGCARARTDTKTDALRMAACLRAPVELHLSGCERSCALPRAAAHTLLATGPGQYDLYRRDGDAGFGRIVARHLTIDQAAALVDGLRQIQDSSDA